MPGLRLAALVLAVAIGAAAPATGQVRFRDVAKCTTPEGERPELMVSRMRGASAHRSLDGRRTLILMNPHQHRAWTMRLAVFFHECAHFHQPSGVGYHRRRVKRLPRALSELRADCTGIRMMARAGLLSVSGWRYILRRVTAMRATPGKHPAGPIRAANLRRCIRSHRHMIRPDHRVPRITRW